jgi:hypothetical protein
LQNLLTRISRPYRLAALAFALMFLAAMAMASARHNALLIDAPAASGSVEWDFYYSYVRDAMRIAGVQAPRDEFRGPLYPLVLAVAHLLLPFGSYFAIAKVISLVSGALALVAVYLIAEEALGPLYGLAAMVATAAVAAFELLSFLAGTDMFFACLLLFALCFLIRALRQSAPLTPLIASGVLSGLAMCTRWNAVFLPATAVFAFALAFDLPAHERARRLGVFLAAFVVVMLPWLVLNAFLHGNPLHSRNYVNARIGIFDGKGPYFDSLSATIMYDPPHFLRQWGLNIVRNIAAVGKEIFPLSLFAVPGLLVVLLGHRRTPRLLALLACCAMLFVINAIGPYVVRQYLVAIALFAIAGTAFLEWLGSLQRVRAFALSAGLLAWGAACAGLLAASIANLNLVSATELTQLEANKLAGVKPAVPLIGDWDGDGNDDIGVSRDRTNGYKVFYLFDGRGESPAKWIAAFGGENSVPIAGDWDGDGKTSIGVFREGVFFLNNHNASGHAEITSIFGDKDGIPVIGDWDGDGKDSLGTFKDGVFKITNQITSPFATLTFTFGGPGDTPVAGDWDGDGKDTVGVFRDGVFTLTNRSGPPFDDVWQVRTGVPGKIALAGRFNGQRVDKPIVYDDGTFYYIDSSLPNRWRIDLERLSDLPVAGED